MNQRHQRQKIESNQRSVDSSLVRSATSGAGEALPSETRASLEPLFQHSFSDVRVFSDAPAASAAESLEAKAFTVGQNIAFSDGRYAPDTFEGQRLLMHELAHTIQQGSVGALPDRLEVSRRGDRAERNADAIVSGVGMGPVPAPVSSGAAVQLEEEDKPVDWSLDPRDPHVRAGMPIGSGTGTASIDSTAANLAFNSPDLSAHAGYNWQTGANADLKYQLSPEIRAAMQANQSGVDGQFHMPNLDLAAGLKGGAPYANGSGQYGPLSGNFKYDPSAGFDAEAMLKWQTGQFQVGTGGAALQQQVGPVSGSVSTDWNRIKAQATGTTSIYGQPLTLSGGGGIGLDGTHPSLDGRVTAPNIGGTPFSPYAGGTYVDGRFIPQLGLGAPFSL
jgi:Domain of unknown function (DUF4157)